MTECFPGYANSIKLNLGYGVHFYKFPKAIELYVTLGEYINYISIKLLKKHKTKHDFGETKGLQIRSNGWMLNIEYSRSLSRERSEMWEALKGP
jgi:hypothetical protein